MGCPTTQIGNCRLILGDCRAVLPTLGMVDAVITDPPYGQQETHARHLSTIRLRPGEAVRQSLGFFGLAAPDYLALVEQWTAICRGWVVFTCEWQYMMSIAATGNLVRFGLWIKPDGAPQFTGDRPGTGWEAVAICHRPGKKRWHGGGKHGIWTYLKGRAVSGHPTEKPLALFKAFLADFTSPGDTVLDPFMGSGTTGVACLDLGRSFIGIEIDPHFYTIACQRMTTASRQFPLFPSTPLAPSPQLSLLPG